MDHLERRKGESDFENAFSEISELLKQFIMVDKKLAVSCGKCCCEWDCAGIGIIYYEESGR